MLLSAKQGGLEIKVVYHDDVENVENEGSTSGLESSISEEAVKFYICLVCICMVKCSISSVLWSEQPQTHMRHDRKDGIDEKSCAEHGSVQDHAQDSQPNFHMSLAEVWQNVTQHERKIWSERCARVKKLEKEQFEKGWISAQTVHKVKFLFSETFYVYQVILITGYANSRCDKDPLIKINLLQKFPQNVREDPNNGGRLIFPAKFNFSNGYVT
ncbi:Protein CBG24428 [Caenorhabditis briggsae]|uniref:Protein CBG24428 n=1 Tax=Caenorhabditis briggsae TaxID=6238 RepID=A8WKP5_CAEBR|nr:Protein CBG24428 [Caenorhabditis briggsae]CAP21040.2 Protein CBG24428 [Caenorhabditis briggsae]